MILISKRHFFFMGSAFFITRIAGEKEMIEERIVGSRKNMEWMRRELLHNPRLRILRISKVYPVKGTDGKYCVFAHYMRAENFSKKGRKMKRRKKANVQGYRSSQPERGSREVSGKL